MTSVAPYLGTVSCLLKWVSPTLVERHVHARIGSRPLSDLLRDRPDLCRSGPVPPSPAPPPLRFDATCQPSTLDPPARLGHPPPRCTRSGSRWRRSSPGRRSSSRAGARKTRGGHSRSLGRPSFGRVRGHPVRHAMHLDPGHRPAATLGDPGQRQVTLDAWGNEEDNSAGSAEAGGPEAGARHTGLRLRARRDRIDRSG